MPSVGVAGAVHVDQTGLAGQHGRGQHVVGAHGHRDDVALDRIAAVGLQRLPDLGEHRERAGTGLVQRRRRTGQRPAGRQLLGQQAGSVIARQVGVEPVLLLQPVDELSDGVMVCLGVLANVQRGQMQTVDRDGALHPRQ